MAATVRQIAARANVSPSTVSRALNNHPHVDEATRTLVLEAARTLGYGALPTQRAARSLRTVLVLLREIGQFVPVQPDAAPMGMYNDIVRGLSPVLDKHGIVTHLWGTSMDPQEVHRSVVDLNVAGIVFVGGIVNRDFVASLQSARVPFIIVGSHVQPLQINCVMPDYLAGIQAVVEHLADTGRRRIGFINGPSTTTSSAEKQRGFRLGLALRDLPFLDTVIAARDFSAAAGEEATRRLLQRCPDLDAIAYASDEAVPGGLSALRNAGRSVPDDIAVTGFYSYDISRFTNPPTTTVHTDWVLAGQLAGRRLCMLCNEPDDLAWTTVFPVTLLARQSSAPRREA